MVALFALLITAMIPKSVRFPYTYESGKPWRYEDLLAPYDFPILKSDAELAEDERRIREDFIPYYTLQEDIPEQVSNQFRQIVRKRWPPLQRDSILRVNALDSTVVLVTGQTWLYLVYRQGLLQPDSLHRNASAGKALRELRGPDARTAHFGDYFQPDSLPPFLPLPDGWPPEIQRWLEQQLLLVLQPNLTFERNLSDELLQANLSRLSSQRGKVGQGEKIIFTGELVSAQQQQVLDSYKAEFERYTNGYQPYALWFGYFAIVSISLVLYAMFLLQFKEDVFRHGRSLLFILLLITAFVALTIFSERQDFPTLFLVPYCIVPIIIRTFFGTRTALFTHLVVLLIAGFLISHTGEFMFLHLLAGLAAIFSNIRAQYWSQFFTAMAWLLLTYVLSWMAIGLVQQGSVSQLDTQPFLWLALNVFFCLMAYPLILVFERLFGVVSDITLRELSDLNKPLLRELSLKAPGTMQHSVQVANLAEAAIADIGGNTLLTRVGALYHDIGKVRHPIYYIENQASGDSPHDALEPEESARMIISHVENGITLAKKHRLPDSVIDFIRTHHGTTRVEFFWNRYQKLRKPEHADLQTDARFRYAGPLPFSRETAVVMLADSLEAASRVLKQPTDKDIDQLVDRIVQYKIDNDQLVHSDLTFRDLHQIGKVFRKMLLSIHHVRIAYPEMSSSGT